MNLRPHKTYHPSDDLYHNRVQNGEEAMDRLIAMCDTEIFSTRSMIIEEQNDPLFTEDDHFIAGMEQGIKILEDYKKTGQRVLAIWREERAKNPDADDSTIDQRTAQYLRLHAIDQGIASEETEQIAEALESGDYSGLAV